jgi:hypothetical protein
MRSCRNLECVDESFLRQFFQGQNPAAFDCTKPLFEVGTGHLREKQIPQVVGKTEKTRDGMERLGGEIHAPEARVLRSVPLNASSTGDADSERIVHDSDIGPRRPYGKRR